MALPVELIHLRSRTCFSNRLVKQLLLLIKKMKGPKYLYFSFPFFSLLFFSLFILSLYLITIAAMHAEPPDACLILSLLSPMASCSSSPCLRGPSHERQLAQVARARAAGQGSSSTHGQHGARARGREGQRRAASAPPHADVSLCPRAWKKAGASTAKYAMGPRAPDKELVGARFLAPTDALGV